MKRRLYGLLMVATLVLIAQQQLLQRRPPRLVEIKPEPIHSGSTALNVRFSRPMQRSSVATTSVLKPSLKHRWLGTDTPLRLIVDADRPIEAAVELTIAGTDQRGNALQPQRWWWDPRPWLLVSRVTDEGEQLQLLTREGEWQPLSPVWSQIQTIVPLGNGRGVAMVSSNGNREERIWWKRLMPHTIATDRRELTQPTALALEPLLESDVLFAHLSSNLIGDLLVQSGGLTPGSERFELIRSNGKRQQLDLLASGPMQLLPGGGGLLVPTYNGLTLRPLIDTDKPAQVLPGSREVGALCAASGRAVLIRHWPDYRRSIELVIPGLAPKQLWLGEQAVLAVSCNSSGDQIWAVLGSWQGEEGQHEIIQINGDGTVRDRMNMSPWTLKPGTPLQFDPISQRLLLTVTKTELDNGRPGLINATPLSWDRILPVAINEAHWLIAG